ncbi:glycosyltransferase family 4 protein [Halpernia frigidisoli]|uniref:Glycosyltransferase involved in cell wall bisynthesis n=1 Tax=Halpernia frigidisoli TaxID=1125876 RepID=A0A1I3FCI3_9FLAO|nr:glycosyltransferase family 4 protein [Halpernia frigidisoli]SFI08925.1 Glycosyltransferase involved in cell wall bisynthesis [Halpernia frigidisoli]
MKILIISQYFFPESFKINDIALGLVEKGHEVSVLTGVPNYPQGEFYEGYSFNSKDEIWNGIKIYRSKLLPRKQNGISLFINYISFVIFGWMKVSQITENFDQILVYGLSPVTVGLPAIKASKKFKAPYYFWVQDLWPQSLYSAGGIKNKYIISFFDKITRLIYRKAEKVLVQSKGFKEYILKQDVPAEKIVFYPNTTENFYKKESVSARIEQTMPDGFRIMFAGNLGEAQSLETLINAAEILRNRSIPVKWIFLGDGRNRVQIEKLILEKNLKNEVFLLGSFPATEMPHYFASADALVLSLKKDEIFALTIPSKLQSYLACEKPIIASLNGEGAKVVEKGECGFVSPAEDFQTLAQNIEKLYYLSTAERDEMGKRASDYFNKNFGRDKLLNDLVNLMDK